MVGEGGGNTVQLTWTAELGQGQIFWAVGHAKVTESNILIPCTVGEICVCVCVKVNVFISFKSRHGPCH